MAINLKKELKIKSVLKKLIFLKQVISVTATENTNFVRVKTMRVTSEMFHLNDSNNSAIMFFFYLKAQSFRLIMENNFI